jgi:hypothetical protein
MQNYFFHKSIELYLYLHYLYDFGTFAINSLNIYKHSHSYKHSHKHNHSQVEKVCKIYS